MHWSFVQNLGKESDEEKGTISDKWEEEASLPRQKAVLLTLKLPSRIG